MARSKRTTKTPAVQDAKELMGDIIPTPQEIEAKETAVEGPSVSDPIQAEPAPAQETALPSVSDPIQGEPAPPKETAVEGPSVSDPIQGEPAPAQETALPSVSDPIQGEPAPPQETAAEGPSVSDPIQGEPAPAQETALPSVSDPIQGEPAPPQETAAEGPSVSDPIQGEDRKALARRLTEEIRDEMRSAQRKVWRMYSERLWQELGYETFEEYILLEFGHERNWGYKQVTLVKAANALEAKGVANPLANLSAEAAQVFRRWENRPEVFTLAYTAVVERDEKPTQDRLVAECVVQNEYLQEADRTPGLTQEEYQAYRKLEAVPYSYDLDKSFESADKLLEEARRLKRRPPLKRITKVVRGDDLIALLAQLEPLSADVKAIADLKNDIATLDKETREAAEAHRKKLDAKRTKQAELAKLEGEEDEEEEHEDEDEEEPEVKKKTYSYQLAVKGGGILKGTTDYPSRSKVDEAIKETLDANEKLLTTVGQTSFLSLTILAKLEEEAAKDEEEEEPKEDEEPKAKAKTVEDAEEAIKDESAN